MGRPETELGCGARFNASSDSAFLVFTPNLPDRAPVASIMDSMPERISAGKCFINSASL